MLEVAAAERRLTTISYAYRAGLESNRQTTIDR